MIRESQLVEIVPSVSLENPLDGHLFASKSPHLVQILIKTPLYLQNKGTPEMEKKTSKTCSREFFIHIING